MASILSVRHRDHETDRYVGADVLSVLVDAGGAMGEIQVRHAEGGGAIVSVAYTSPDGTRHHVTTRGDVVLSRQGTRELRDVLNELLDTQHDDLVKTTEDDRLERAEYRE